MAKDNGIFHFKWVKSGLNIDFIYFEPYVGHHDASVTLWGHLGKKLRIDYKGHFQQSVHIMSNKCPCLFWSTPAS